MARLVLKFGGTSVADIARIRQGLQDYLAPSRAQPRDAAELSGQYQREGAQP